MRRKIFPVVLAAIGIAAAQAQTVAVLPFANASRQAFAPVISIRSAGNMDWIGESIAETLRDSLAARGLVTLSRSDTQEAYHRLSLREGTALTHASALKAGEVLDAEQVIFGTFEFVPAAGTPAPSRGTIRVSSRILDRLHPRPPVDMVESGPLENLGPLEAHLVWRALRILTPDSAPKEADYQKLRLPIRLDAEENYVRGLMSSSPERREGLFAEAARLDNRFTRPAFELGKIYYGRGDYTRASEWLSKIPPEDVHYRESTFLLGLARFQRADYQGAQKAFQTIAETFPLSEVLNNLGAAESRKGLPSAVDHFRAALGGDPSDPVYHFNLGYALMKKGDYAAAVQSFRAVVGREPENSMATLLLGLCLKGQGFPLTKSGEPEARFRDLERLKLNYEERAYRQLKSLLDPAKR